ncbi:MAG: hypothetical protein JWN04_4695, partial [Myxococcaceae bacterium]|nr:hypothetical protein [Myxococcaceae bacterium]
MAEPGVWKVCSICRKSIAAGQLYYACNVS